MATEKVEVYVLDVRVPKQDALRVRVDKELSLGSDSGCDIRIQEFGLAPLQGRFRVQNNVLTFTQLGPDDSLKVGSQKCGHGRMYILDKGDKCVIDKVKLIVRKEKVEIDVSEEEEIEDDDVQAEDFTDEHEVDGGGTLKAIDDDSTSTEQEYEIVEEVVYVDEDGNEVTAKKEPTFVSKFRDLVKRKEDSKKKPVSAGNIGAPKITKGAKIRDPVAGPLFRGIGLAYNIGFFIFFFKMGLPLIKEKTGFDLLSYANKAMPLIKPYLSKLPNGLPVQLSELPYLPEVYQFILDGLANVTTYRYLVAFITYELIFQFLLGIGLGQFLIGLSNGGHHILNRVFAPIRVVLSIVLLPLLVFDFPVLRGERSFKEIITFSRYERRSLALTLILALVIMPILAIIGANYRIYPAFFELTTPITTKGERTITIPTSKFKDEKVKLETISFNAKGNALVAKTTAILPSFEIKGNEVKPKIVAASSLKSNTTELVRRTDFLKESEVFEKIKQDPFLFLLFPELDLAIKSLSQKKKVPVNTKELMKVIFYALSLDVKKPWPSFLQLGPILSPYYELQKVILQKLNAKRINIVELIIGPNESMIHLGNSDQLANRYILRITDESFDVLNFTYTQESQILNKEVMENVFFLTGPYRGRYDNRIEKAFKLKDLPERAFAVVDIFEHLIKGNKIKKNEAIFLKDFFLELAAETLKSENDDFQQIVIDNFEVLDKGLSRIKLKNNDQILRDLRIDLNNVQQALNKRNQKFFDLNIKK